ncbi:ArsR/SmtB family transcription factor [Streptomyces pakalii]|uniref:Helix-turn-helix domain-containing protein n=1 Tax=Streptomyces pakalii TaxID=3036494 RepID=A0ABT7DHR2_9ACTN|nr:helix-turn-helix domain-containing protein [Streptomyces pakalii]MDJ1645374.1 helix-turn-helix domain-containing protein [Streptomyces pakalii]
MATAEADTVRVQFGAFLNGGSARRRSCSWLREDQLRAVDDRVSAGIETFGAELPQRLASEMHLLWSTVFARRWATFTTAFEQFIDCHSGVVAREGLAGALSALHTTLAWRDNALEIASHHQGKVEGSHPITLIPTLHLGRVGLHAPYHTDAAQIAVPLNLTSTAAPRIAPVLGDTRLRLLQDLDQPRTTTELAALHYLSPSTISFHLSRLLAAGLVQKHRDGRLVRYHRTTKARQLLCTTDQTG